MDSEPAESARAKALKQKKERLKVLLAWEGPEIEEGMLDGEDGLGALATTSLLRRDPSIETELECCHPSHGVLVTASHYLCAEHYSGYDFHLNEECCS